MADQEKLKKIYKALADKEELEDIEDEEHKDELLNRLNELKVSIIDLQNKPKDDTIEKNLLLIAKSIDNSVINLSKDLPEALKTKEENKLVSEASAKRDSLILDQLSNIGSILLDTRQLIDEKDYSNSQLDVINKSLEGVGSLLIQILSKTGSNDSFRIKNSSGSVVDPSTSSNQATEISLLQSISGFDIPQYDYISLGYTSSNLTTVTFKTGGSSGIVVGTLTLGYDGSNNLISVTKS